MGCNLRGDYGVVAMGIRGAALKHARQWRDASGQGTVEYALVALVLLAIIVALGQLFLLVNEGSFVRHAEGSASHSLSTHNAQGVVGDVLLY